MFRLFVALALAFALSACGSTSDGVDWSKYPPGSQAQIDTSDCRELEEVFDALAQKDDEVRAEHGSGTSDIVGYVYDRIDEAGCY